MKYLITATEGPGFFASDEMAELLENMILPSLQELVDMEEEGEIIGGLPVGDRAFVFIVDSDSHDDLDRMLRSLPLWGLLEWEVTPLQDFDLRAAQEREILKGLKQKS